jgi:hypothetical protein
MKPLVLLPIIFALASPSFAAECRSVGGHLNGHRVAAVRSVKLSSATITLAGTFEGKRAPRRSLPCKVIAKGVYCDRAFDGVIVTVMTNGNRMIENVKDQVTGKEMAGIAYVCNEVMKP